MNQPDTAVTLRMPEAWLWLLRVGAVAAGLVLGALVGPLVDWLDQTVGSAPGRLRVAAALPLGWAVPVLGIIGGLVGIWLAGTARRESLVLTVSATHVQVQQDGHPRHIPEKQRPRCFSTARTESAYPWRGTSNPYEVEYRRWVDGHPDLDERTHRMLRARASALTEKKAAEAEALAEDLANAGIIVRDRKDAHEYRRIPAAG